MITKINDSSQAIDALNENLEGLLNGKRKQPLAKEVNNTIGKIINVVKMDLIHKTIIGDRSPSAWFVSDQKAIKKVIR